MDIERQSSRQQRIWIRFYIKVKYLMLNKSCLYLHLVSLQESLIKEIKLNIASESYQQILTKIMWEWVPALWAKWCQKKFHHSVLLKWIKEHLDFHCTYTLFAVSTKYKGSKVCKSPPPEGHQHSDFLNIVMIHLLNNTSSILQGAAQIAHRITEVVVQHGKLKYK